MTGLLCDLLSVTPIFAEGIFDTETAFSFHDLSLFRNACEKLKPVIENALGFEVNTGEKMAMKQLNAVLGVIGQRALEAERFKTGSNAVYRYKLGTKKLDLMQEITARRRDQQAWAWINEHYGWTDQSDDDLEE